MNVLTSTFRISETAILIDCSMHSRSQRGVVGAGAPSEITIRGQNLWEQVVSALLRARVHPLGGESHFYWAEDGVAFNLEGLGVIS